MGKKKTWKNIKRAFPLYIMVAPGFLYLLINNYVPMTGIIIAFKHLNFAKGILHSDWAGLSNFEYLFKTPDAALITRNTLLYNFAFIVVNTTVSILIAILRPREEGDAEQRWTRRTANISIHALVKRATDFIKPKRTVLSLFQSTPS